MQATILQSSNLINHDQLSCCSATPDPQLIKKVDIICRIAIGIFSLAIAPAAFSISFSLGFLGGAGYAFSRLIQGKTLFPSGESKPVCAQGYMDFLSGMRFPPVIGSIATTTFIGAHMRHDPQFYVPFCGLFIGLWTGREFMCSVANLADRYITELKQTPTPSCCSRT